MAGVEFRNRLQASFEGLQLSSTLMFDYPTVPDLVDYIYQQVGSPLTATFPPEVGPAEDEQAAGGLGGPLMDAGAMLTIASHAGRYPGCFTNNAFWRQTL